MRQQIHENLRTRLPGEGRSSEVKPGIFTADAKAKPLIQELRLTGQDVGVVATNPAGLPFGKHKVRSEQGAQTTIADALNKFPQLSGQHAMLRTGRATHGGGSSLRWVEAGEWVVVGEKLLPRAEFYETHHPQVDRLSDPHQIGAFQPGADGTVNSMVVVGQGPAGLLTAILTRLDPANKQTRVVLVDKRGENGQMPYSRPIALGVREGFLDILATARSPKTNRSAYDLLMERGQLLYFNPDAAIRIENRVEGTLKITKLRKYGENDFRAPDAKRVGADAYGPVASEAVALVKTAHLEQALADIVRDLPKLHRVNGYTPILTPTEHIGLDGKPAYRIALQQAGKVDGKWQNLGKPVDLGVPDLIVAADGAQSQTVAQTDIRRATGSPMGEYIAADIKIERTDNYFKRVVFEWEGKVVSAYTVVGGRQSEAWMIVQSGDGRASATPPGAEALALCRRMIFEAYYKGSGSQGARQVEDLQAKLREAKDPDARQALAKEETLLIERLVTIEWGGAQPFTLRPSMVETSLSGNFATAGDATGNNTFAGAAGTNVAGYQAASIANGIGRMNSVETREERSRELKRATDQVYRNAEAWHKIAPEETRAELHEKLDAIRATPE